MIKVIDGKRYNTDTAEHVLGHSNGHFSSDFKYRSKDLYRTNKGAWFLHHEGGALSDMAVSISGGSEGSSSIEPVTDDDAFGFLQAHSDDSKSQEAIDTHFADRIEEA